MMSTKQKTDVNVIAVENNSWSNAALDDEGRVWTWGNSHSTYRLGRNPGYASDRVNPYNRGGQVLETVYAGEKLPFILQISGSEENTLALDRVGNVWSWGSSASGALGRSGSNRLPGKVEFPEGVTIKWIAAAYHGGKAIDSAGNIWVWGNGRDYALGTGNTSNVSTPVKLTLDSSDNPLPTNFIQIRSSDFYNDASAIALTKDGKVFTWGNNNVPETGGATRPRQTGFNNDIKKICAGNGSFGFLTNSGEAWTWGDNRSGSSDGRLGHGNTTHLAEPKRIETVVIGSTIEAPKFRDFSIYAWSMCAVDMAGNIYGCGQNLNSKHGRIGTPTRLTKYAPSGLPTDTEIFILAEGYTSTSYVDVHGNAYVTGQSNAEGNNDNDGSPAGPWVHFTGSGKPMFTLLGSTPTNEVKRYNISPKTTLDIETNVAADEIKYVILYPEDTDQYTDGKTFYSKSFAELEQPYYNKDTDPQLLLSPNYDLPTSRYYANPKISEKVFNAAFDMKKTVDKGTMDVVSGSANKGFRKIDLVSHDCIVWVQSKNSSGTTRAIYRFDNYYTQTKAWHEGVKQDDPSFTLYTPELVGGSYGLFLDRQGTLFPGEPPLGYDIVKPVPNGLTYWKLAPDTQLDEELAEDGYTHRIDRSKEVFLTALSQKGDDATKTPRVTFSYEKNPAMWVEVDLRFVNVHGEPIQVWIGEEAVTEQNRPAFAPKGAAHIDGQEPYLPPEAVNPTSKAVGYCVSTPPECSEESYTECDFPNGFKPVVNEKTIIYIVYNTGMVSVTETFIDISGDQETEIKNNAGQLSTVKNLRLGSENYDYPGPDIHGYVLVGHETITDEDGTTRSNYPWVIDQYVPKNALISPLTNNSSVRFLYKADTNGDRIPDDEEGLVPVHWIAVTANNIAYEITQKTICGNGKWGATLTIEEDKETVLPSALYNPDQWLFRPGQPLTDTLPYLPVGSGETAVVTLSIGQMPDVYFYYDEDYNANGIADKAEGFFTEKYKLSSSGEDLTPPKADTVSQWLGGQTYSKEAPLIQNYVSVGYLLEGDGVPLPSDERVEKDQTGHVTVRYDIPFEETKENYTVTFLYKEDLNKNQIPDDEEGRATIQWIGTTFAGNTVELATLVLDGYIGDEVVDMIVLPNEIDTVWRLVGDNVPDSILLSATPQSYQYRYEEVLEFSTITVENKSTDGHLDFYYQYTKRLTDGAFDVTAFAIPTYRVTGYTLYDNYGNLAASGAGDTVTIDPATGSQRVVFLYVSTVTTVVIRAVDASDDTNVLQSQTITDALIGQKYAAVAPYVDDTWVLTGELLQVIDVESGTNFITFEYEKATGNVTVLLREGDTNGPIIRVLSETVTQENSKAIDIPDLSGSYYTQLSTEKIIVDYSGADPVPHIVEYYYEKNLMDVAIKALDDSDGSEIKTVSYTAVARKGESYTAVAPTVEWYTLTESSSKSVYVDPGALDNTIPVHFFYKKDHIGTITVRCFYQDEDHNEVELRSYTAKSVVGNKFSAVADSFPGFVLVNPDRGTVEIIVNEDSDTNSIQFEYTDLRKTVGLFTQIGTDETTRQTIDESRYVIGSEPTIIPPYMNNHLVVGYIIDTEEMVDVDPMVFTHLTLSGADAITDDMSIVFVYAPVEAIVEDRFSDVAIQGVTGAITHYRYLKRIAKSELPLTLTSPAHVFDVPGHVLDSEADFVVTDATTEMIFRYHPLATTVTIRMVDGTGTDVANGFAVDATAGAPFTYNAPNVPDYYLAGPSLGKADSVLADGTSEIVFTYERITSKVTIIAKEEDTNGRMIGVFEVSNPTSGTTTYDVPDLTADYYTANAPTVEITFDGTNSTSVEAYYTKDRVSVEIEAVHALNGTDLGTQAPLLDQRKGEAVTVAAPDITDYFLVGSATQIVIADGTNKAVFQYRPLENDEIVVKAVDTEGNILQRYLMKGSMDETVWVEPPVLLGWKTSDTAKSAVIGTDREIVFDYTKNVVIVTIQAVDSEGNLLNSTDVEAAKGGGYTAHAPHIAGYVIDGNTTYTLTNLAADETVTFFYQTTPNAVAMITVIGKSEDEVLYRYSILRTKNSGLYDVDARELEEYRLIDITPVTVDVQEENETVTFEYESIFTTVTIYMLEESTSAFLAIFHNRAVTGESYTFHAPNIVKYNLTSPSAIGNVSTVLPNGASGITFTYQRS